MPPPDIDKSPPNADNERRIDPGAGTQLGLERFDLDRAPRGAATASVPISFEQLYRDYFDFTFRTLRHLGVPEETLPDAVQEVWLAVHRQLTGFEGRSSHRTWLFAIALNTARNQRRWRLRHDRLTALPANLPDRHPGPDQIHAEREAFELVREFLATLDEPRRILFISQLIEELSAEETAGLLGIERQLVYHRLRDLRRSFKRWIVQRQGGSQ